MAGYEWKVRLKPHVDSRTGANTAGMHEQPDTDMSQVDPAKVAQRMKEAIERGVEIDVRALANGPVGAAIRKAAYMSRKQTSALRFVDRLRDAAVREMESEAGSETARGGVWYPGQPLSQLDPVRSVIAGGGELHYGVTTVERVQIASELPGPPKSRSYAHITFIVDTSGSMGRGVAPPFRVHVFRKDGPNEPEYLWRSNVPGPEAAKDFGGYMDHQGRPFPVLRVVRADNSEPVDEILLRRFLEVAQEVGVAFIGEAKRLDFSISIHQFHAYASVVYPVGKDYDLAMWRLLGLAAPGPSTNYAAGLEAALKDAQALREGMATVFLTDEGDVGQFLPNELAFGQLNRLVRLGPVLLMLFGFDPEGNEGVLKAVQEAHGERLSIAAFPDLSSDDAVFAAARWAIRL